MNTFYYMHRADLFKVKLLKKKKERERLKHNFKKFLLHMEEASLSSNSTKLNLQVQRRQTIIVLGRLQENFRKLYVYKDVLPLLTKQRKIQSQAVVPSRNKPIYPTIPESTRDHVMRC